MLSPPLTLAVALLGISIPGILHSEIKYVKLTFPCDITHDVEKHQWLLFAVQRSKHIVNMW